MKKLLILFGLLISISSFAQHGVNAVLGNAEMGSVKIDNQNFAADAEASDTYVITLSPIPAAYMTGEVFLFTANTANTGPASLNVNGLGAKTILKLHDLELSTGDIESGQAVMVFYDGTNFQMLSQLAQ